MNDQPKIVLFQGDSITDGGRPRDRDGLGSSYPHLIAARISADLAASAPTFMNRGISGNRVSDMSARWNEDAYALNPNLISILIGVNDAWRMVRQLPTGVQDRFARVYDALLAEIREVTPSVKLVLMEPFVLKTEETEPNWDVWQDIMPRYQRTVRELAERYQATYVPLQQLLNEACDRSEASFWLYDGVHPTAAGHQLIADQWLSIVKQSEAAAWFQAR